MDLFQSLTGLSRFRESSIILLFTKLDLFNRKIEESPITDFFPDYGGALDDSKDALRYFASKFLLRNRFANRKINVLFTDATDTSQSGKMIRILEDLATKGRGDPSDAWEELWE